MKKVTLINKSKPVHDIPKMLRRLSDELEEIGCLGCTVIVEHSNHVQPYHFGQPVESRVVKDMLYNIEAARHSIAETYFEDDYGEGA